MFDLYGKSYARNDVVELLDDILKHVEITYDNDRRFIADISPRLKQGHSPSLGQMKYIKDILFKYANLTEALPHIPVTQADLIWARDQVTKFADQGAFRYPGVQAERGVAGE